VSDIIRPIAAGFLDFRHLLWWA